MAHAETDQISEKGVAIEAGAILAKLHEPAPDGFGGRVNIDGVRDYRRGEGRKSVAGEYGDAVEVRGAPVQMPGAKNVEIGEEQSCKDDDDNRRGIHSRLRSCVSALYRGRCLHRISLL